MPTSLLKPWVGFSGYQSYSPELQRDLRVVDQFLRDIRAAVGKGLGEAQITNTTVTNVVTSTQVIAGTDLDGGGPLTADVTIDHADTVVTPGSYTYASLTVNQRGHLTAASSGSTPAALASTTPTDITLIASNVGTGTTAARSDHRHGLDVTIAPTWSAVHTFSSQDVHNAGVSLGSNGGLTRASVTANSGVANLTFTAAWSATTNTAGDIGYLLKPNALMGANASILQVQTSGAAQLMDLRKLGPTGGGNTQFRLGFDSSNYLQAIITSVGSTTLQPVGTGAGLTFTSPAGVTFTATTGLTLTGATATINPSTSLSISTPSVITQDGLVITNSANTTGLKIGGTGDKIWIGGHSAALVGFFGITPIARPSAFTQTYSTASHTHPNLVATAVATTAATNTLPYGYTTQAQADDIITQLNALRLDVDALKQVANAVIDDGQALGLLQ